MKIFAPAESLRDFLIEISNFSDIFNKLFKYLVKILYRNFHLFYFALNRDFMLQLTVFRFYYKF